MNEPTFYENPFHTDADFQRHADLAIEEDIEREDFYWMEVIENLL